MNDEIQRIISRKGKSGDGANIHAAVSYLRAGKKTGVLDKKDKHFKLEETERLRQYVENRHLWLKDIDLNSYISQGAEQKVYLKDGRSVFKLNDAIYFLSWIDYFVNLLLHNYFFPDTAYKLLGFFEDEKIVYAVVEQQFITATEPTDLKLVEQFMNSNGFYKIRNNDYANDELEIILEDLHDENVLTRNGILYFIDTVFFLKQ